MFPTETASGVNIVNIGTVLVQLMRKRFFHPEDQLKEWQKLPQELSLG